MFAAKPRGEGLFSIQAHQHTGGQARTALAARLCYFHSHRTTPPADAAVETDRQKHVSLGIKGRNTSDRWQQSAFAAIGDVMGDAANTEIVEAVPAKRNGFLADIFIGREA